MNRRLKYWLEALYPIWLGIIFALIVLPFTQYELEVKSFLFACMYMAFCTSPLWGPAVYLLSNYMKNDNKIEHIDSMSRSLQADGKSYNIQQVALIRRNPKMDLGFDFLPWSNFKYLMLDCSDGNKFYISCLNKHFNELNPTKILNKKYPRIPYFETELVNSKTKSEIGFWKIKYASKSRDELEKITGSKEYEKSAVEAAKQLLNESADNIT